MRSKLGTVCMGLGAVLVLAALSLFLWNQRENRMAQASVEEILPQILEQIDLANLPTDPGEEPTYPDPYDPTMRTVEIDGYDYVGYLDMPSIKLRLPVMSQWDYTRLKIAPCRYSGSTKTDNLVICGHNYTGHFGPVQKLVPGDKVYFTDMDGKVWRYTVETVEILPPTDVEEMTAGEYDLTLFTCTYGGQSRATVRCSHTEEA